MGKVFDHEGEEVGFWRKWNPYSDYGKDLRKSKKETRAKREAEVGKGPFRKLASGMYEASGIFARLGAGVGLLVAAFFLAKDGFKQFLTPAYHLFTNVVGGAATTVKENLPGAKTAAALGHKAVVLGGKAVDAVQPYKDAAGNVTEMVAEAGVHVYDKANAIDRKLGNTIHHQQSSGEKANEYFQVRAVRPETGECRMKLIQELNKQRGINPQQPGATPGSPQPQTSATPPAIPTIPGCDY